MSAITATPMQQQATALLDALVAGFLDPGKSVRAKCDAALFACGQPVLGYLAGIADSDSVTNAQQARLSDLIDRIAYLPSLLVRGDSIQAALVECLRVKRPVLKEKAFRAIACMPMMFDELVSLAVSHRKNRDFCVRLLRAASLTGGTRSSSSWFDLWNLLQITKDGAVRVEAVKLMEAIRQSQGVTPE